MKSGYGVLAGAMVVFALAIGRSDEPAGPGPSYSLGPGENAQFVTIDQTVGGPALSVYSVNGSVRYVIDRPPALPRGPLAGSGDMNVTLRVDLQIRRVECDERCERILRTSVDRIYVEAGEYSTLEKMYVFGPSSAPRFLRLTFRVLPGAISLTGVRLS